MKKAIILYLVILSSYQFFGQQLPQFSLRAYDLMNYNPAVAGSRLNQEIRLHHRSQWVGFENAPKSDFLSYNASINRVGLGASVFYDSEVITKNFGANLMYAYHIFCNKFNISLGASAGIQQYQINTSMLNPSDQDDPLLTNGASQTKLTPSVGGGVFLYNRNCYIGSSFSYYLPVVLDKGINENPTSLLYYAMAGYNFQLSDNFKLLTQAFFSGQEYANYQYEFGVRGQFMDVFSLGVGYRPNDAIVLSTSIKLLKNILIAYSYDIVTSALRNYNSGSHEIVLSYTFNNKKSPYYEHKNTVKRKIDSDIIF
jgi:type IX secretion system PorP/SprF family membrane protein